MYLKRQDTHFLNHWYNGPLRKMPAVLFGARQVGKSTLAAEFAKSTGRNVINVNFWKDSNEVYRRIFQENSSATEVLSALEVVLGQRIIQDNTFLILDEIQSCPRAYSLCKSFKEDTQLPVIATGSYLRLLLHYGNVTDQRNEPFEIPVGCTYEKLVTPLSFSEYLLNRNQPLFERFQNLSLLTKIDNILHEQLLKSYYEYLYVGGMPEAVSIFLDVRNNSMQQALEGTREIHKALLSGYQNDFLTFGRNTLEHRNLGERLHYTFLTIARELHKYRETDTPVKRFRFTSLGKNAEYKRVANVFDYLERCGLILKTQVLKNPQEPLFVDEQQKNAFKCFYFDVGILNTQLKVPFRSINEDTWMCSKGPIAENFVAQQLHHCHREGLSAWKKDNYEIEFLHNHEGAAIPIEVKASKKSRPSVSLKKYVEAYKPQKAYKVAPRNFGRNEDFISLPIYLVEKICQSDEH